MKLPERQLQRALANGNHLLNNQLIRSTLRIDINVATAKNLLPIFDFKFQPLGRTSPNDGRYLASVVFKRQVLMPGCGPSQTGNFATHPDLRKLPGQCRPNLIVELGDRNKARFGHRLFGWNLWAGNLRAGNSVGYSLANDQSESKAQNLLIAATCQSRGVADRHFSRVPNQHKRCRKTSAEEKFEISTCPSARSGSYLNNWI